MPIRSITKTLFVCALALLPGIAISQTLALPYRPVAAEYSTALDRIITTANPNQLHIYNPATKTDVAVNLSKPPLSVSVSPDGMHAAVGHDGLISYVNLATQLFEKRRFQLQVQSPAWLWVPVTFIFPISAPDPDLHRRLDSPVSVPGATFARLHPGGAGLYTVSPTSPSLLTDVDVSNGPMGAASAGPYSGDFPVCGGLWFSQDGRRVYTGCGYGVPSQSLGSGHQ